MPNVVPAKPVHVLGVPLDHGAGRRGVGMGPSAVRLARLHETLGRIGCKVIDHGDIHIPAPETQAPGDPRAKFLPLIAEVCAQTAATVQGITKEGGLPLVIGGDHSIAIGTISGVANHLHERHGAAGLTKLGVIWFDAHGDINTPETSPSGNIHGMPVSCLLGDGPRELTGIGFAGPKVSPMRFAQIGLRDLDDQEKTALRASGIHAFTMADIDKRGMADVIAEALRVTSDGAELLHVSFDVDALDPRVAPGTGTAVAGGLTYREAHLALEIVASSGRLTSLEVVEVNPTLDFQNQTAELAVGLIASALGKQIL